MVVGVGDISAALKCFWERSAPARSARRKLHEHMWERLDRKGSLKKKKWEWVTAGIFRFFFLGPHGIARREERVHTFYRRAPVYTVHATVYAESPVSSQWWSAHAAKVSPSLSWKHWWNVLLPAPVQDFFTKKGNGKLVGLAEKGGREWKRKGGREGVREGREGGCSHLDLLHFHCWGFRFSCTQDQSGDLLEGGKVVVMVVVAGAHCRHFIAV